MLSRQKRQGLNEEVSSWSNLIELIEERLAVFRRKELPAHLSLLKDWESKLQEVGDWYRVNGEEFGMFADRMKLMREFSAPVEVIFHDHSYCLRAYRKSKSIFVPHTCDTNCMSASRGHNVSEVSLSPLELPLRQGWQRVIASRLGSSNQQDSYYIAPCGRRLRSMDEVKHYLDLTGDEKLTGVHFTFDPLCSLMSSDEMKYPNERLLCKDISKGKEMKPVSCVSVNSSKPDCLEATFKYQTSRTFDPSISLRNDAKFLICCSCTDNCSNRLKCECWQLTLEEAKVIGNPRYSVGYVHHRLRRPQHSAVYECNSRCKCGTRCSNRVVQAGVSHRLQLFHTGKEQLNWGLRTLDDIPMGTYVCSYVGHVYTEMEAEKRAVQHGDEYLADLDYIEVMEYHKAGYESEPVIPDDLSSISSENATGKSLSTTSTSNSSTVTPFGSTPPDVIVVSSDEEAAMSGEEEEEEAGEEMDLSLEMLSSSSPHDDSIMVPPHLVPPMSCASSVLPKTYTPGLPHLHCFTSKESVTKTRQFYKEDFTYMMDAKTSGNMGRYINHSCDPNLFVQNVFVDSHDLRFPWVTFFAKRRIKAREELTWDYNYNVGSVENKVIQCLCGASNCRKRLL